MIDLNLFGFMGDFKPIDWWNLGLSLAGFLFSIFAYFKALGAKRAVETTLRRSAQQSQRDSARRLLDAVESARAVAMRRKGALGLALRDGRNETDLINDVAIIGAAQDVLAISEFADSDDLNSKMKRSSEEIDIALEQINKDKYDPNGWALALRLLQGITPHIEIFVSKLGSEMIKSNDNNNNKKIKEINRLF